MNTGAQRLRVRLPPLRETRAPFVAAWCEADGVWQRATFPNLQAIASQLQAKQTEICPHPDDVSMTDIEVPPLRAQALRMAVSGALELLALVPPDALIFGYGERNASGTLPVAWLSAAHLQQIQQMFAGAGLHIDSFVAPPAWLPLPAPGQASATVIDNWLVVRSGAGRGAMLPFMPGAADAQRRAQARFADELCWREDNLDGEGWSWTLAHGRPAGNPANWQRPAACWLLAAALVWLGGLNLYAGKLQAQGEAIKAQMAQQVQAAFPQLTVVLNPLQQARQLRDARLSGTLPDSGADFPTLLRLAANLLTDSYGQVARLDYQPGQLDVVWRQGAALRRGEVDALQQQAREKQLAIEVDAAGLHLRPALPAGNAP